LFCFLATWRKFYCLQLLLQCVPESQTCCVVVVQNELIRNGFFYLEWLLWQRLKKQHIYWKVDSKSNPHFKTSKFLSRQKQAQDYFCHACMTEARLSHTSVMFETLCKFKRCPNNMIVILITKKSIQTRYMLS